MVEKLWRCVNLFSYNTSVSRTDGRTDIIVISLSRVSSSMLTRDKKHRWWGTGCGWRCIHRRNGTAGNCLGWTPLKVTCCQHLLCYIKRLNTNWRRIETVNLLSVIIYQWLVCRWVKWTAKDKFCLNSRMSSRLATCRQTVKVTCWSLTASIIAFYCWTVDYNYNASSLTETFKSGCGGQTAYGTTNWRHNSTFYIALRCRGLTSCRYTIYARWLTLQCFTQLAIHFTHTSNSAIVVQSTSQL